MKEKAIYCKIKYCMKVESPVMARWMDVLPQQMESFFLPLYPYPLTKHIKYNPSLSNLLVTRRIPAARYFISKQNWTANRTRFISFCHETIFCSVWEKVRRYSAFQILILIKGLNTDFYLTYEVWKTQNKIFIIHMWHGTSYQDGTLGM